MRGLGLGLEAVVRPRLDEEVERLVLIVLVVVV